MPANFAGLEQISCVAPAATLSCRDDHTDSGTPARIAALATGAREHLPTMATEDFLGNLSKRAVEEVARRHSVRLAPTAREIRANLIKHFAGKVFILPEALFAFSKAEMKAMTALRRAAPPAGGPEATPPAAGSADGSTEPPVPEHAAGGDETAAVATSAEVPGPALAEAA